MRQPPSFKEELISQIPAVLQTCDREVDFCLSKNATPCRARRRASCNGCSPGENQAQL
jgi:hypothetical protein